MNRSMLPLALASLLWSTSQAVAAEDRGAEAILREYDAVSYPSMSDGADPESIARFKKQIHAAAQKQGVLALELAKSHPKNPRVAELLLRRWQLLCNVDDDAKRVLEETAPWLKPEIRDDVRTAAASARARAAVVSHDLDFGQRLELVDAAFAVAPDDELSASCLLQLAKYRSCDPEFQHATAKRLMNALGESSWIASDLKTIDGLLGRIGHEVAIDFGDAIRGAKDAPRSTTELRARPFVVHFAPYPGSDVEASEAAAAKGLRERFGARGLVVLDVAADANGDFRDSIEMKSFQASETPLAVLFDRDGKVAAWSFRVAELAPAIEKITKQQPHDAPAVPAPKKRRVI